MNLSRMSLRLGMSALASVAALAAFAHEPRPGLNGSWKVDAGVWHAELVANDTPNAVVFLYDGADQPVSAEGWSGNAILLVAGAAQRFELTPDANGQLAGVAAACVPKDVKRALQLVAPFGSGVQGARISAYWPAVRKVSVTGASVLLRQNQPWLPVKAATSSPACSGTARPCS